VFDVVPSAAADATDPTALDTAVERPRSDAALLVAAGEVDTLTAPRLEAAVDELLGTGADVLVADLTGVTFLASSGLAVLIRAAHLASSEGRRLRLVAEGRPVLRPLQITGTDELFDLHTDRATALQVDRD
jgi:anti-sigma B factor antagonist